MFSWCGFEYSIDPVKGEMDLGVYDPLIFGIKTAIESNKQKCNGNDTEVKQVIRD